MSPIDRLHFCGWMCLGHDDRLIPISMKPQPKSHISLDLLLITPWICIPQVVEIVLSLHVIHCPVTIVGRVNASCWCFQANDYPCQGLQIFSCTYHVRTRCEGPLDARMRTLPRSTLGQRPTTTISMLRNCNTPALILTLISCLIANRG